MDLTYITERIITIYSPPGCPEEIYLQNLWEIIPMLQSKHGQNYMVRQVDEIKVARENLFLKGNWKANQTDSEIWETVACFYKKLNII